LRNAIDRYDAVRKANGRQEGDAAVAEREAKPGDLEPTLDEIKAKSGEEPRRLLSVDVDLEQFRKLPAVAKGLALPSDDIGRVFALGGWIDLLRRAGRARGELTLE